MAIKSKYRLKHSNGIYETFHFETDADQVLVNSNRLFVSQVEKDKWDKKAEGRHAHGAGDITALMSYTKPSTTSAINNNDSLLTALGKLEKALDGKQASGSYASSSHNHDSVYLNKSATAVAANKLAIPRTINGVPFDGTSNITIKAEADSHWHTSNDVYTIYGYSKPSSTSPIDSSDSLNSALGKLEKGLDNKANSSHSHGEYASTNHTHDYAASNHNHDAWYYGRNGGTINGSITGNIDAIGEMHYKGSGNNADVGYYINADGRLGAYDWRNNRGVFQYHSSNGITDFSTTCIFHGRLRADGGIYMGDNNDRIGRSGSLYLFDINGHWRNSQLNAGQVEIQPWSTEDTGFVINNEAERTNGRTDLTIFPTRNNYGILGRVNRYWYIGWATSWRAASYRESKYDIMKADEERLYNCVKDLNIYNYRRISGNQDEERKETDYRGDLQLGAMVNELPFEVVDHDTELGDGKSVDLYSYSSMIAGGLKATINKFEKENEELKNKINELEEKINGLIQR